MPESLRLSFSGYLDSSWLNQQEQQPSLGFLKEQSHTIAKEIAERISESIGAGPPPNVSIDFAEGSIQWFGFVQWAQEVYPVIQAMSNIAGAYTLIQLVKNAIDFVLRRWFRRAWGPQPFPFVFYPTTQVILVSAPARAGGQLVTDVQNRLFGIAAIITSIAILVAALGWFIRVAR